MRLSFRMSRGLRLVDAVLIIAFVLLIFGVGIAASVLPDREFSPMENRNLASAPELTAESLLSGAFMEDAEDAVSDQMPLREEMVLLRAFIARNAARVAYLPTGDAAVPVYDTSANLLWREESVLVPPPAREFVSYYKRIDRRIEEYERILAECPELELAVYDITPRGYSPINPAFSIMPAPVSSQYTEYFLENKPADIKYDALSLDTKEEFLGYYYKTDAHWSAEGAWQGYLDCCALLGIEPLTLAGFERVEGLPEFRGSLAANAAYISIHDYLREIVVEERWKHTTYANGKVAKRGAREVVLEENKRPNINPFSNYYGWYFGNNHGLVEYVNEEAPDRTLLIIGTSYTNSMEYLFAADYRHVFVADLRNFEDDMGYAFDAVDFIRENGVDQMLMLSQPAENYLDVGTWSLLR